MKRLIKCIINQALISHIRNRAALDIWIQWKYRPYKVRITNVCRIYGQIGDNGTQNYLAFRIDGGAWTEAVNRDADDMVNARSPKRTFRFNSQQW